MNKIANIFGYICLVIGIITSYVGIKMANGKFWGEHYTVGDYTTFSVGCIWLLVGAAFLLIVYFSNKRKLEEINEEGNHVGNNENIGCVPKAIQIFSAIGCISGFLLVIAGIVRDRYFLLIGISTLLLSLLIYGFSYIIEAAIIYIKKHKE